MRKTKQFGFLAEYTAMEELLLAVNPKKVCRKLGSVPFLKSLGVDLAIDYNTKESFEDLVENFYEVYNAIGPKSMVWD
ncbi:hypothetical protein LINPERPRIM_LOCUS31878 [Linum perenne]